MRGLATVAAMAFGLAACGDDTGASGSGGGTTGATSTTTTSADGSTGSGSSGGGPPAASCTQPGAVGNELGVGEYCTPLGKQCQDNESAQLCLADVGQDEWMCTRIGCTEAADCGADAGCLVTDDGAACVPCACDDAGIGCAGGTTSTGAGGLDGSGGEGGG